MKASDLIRKRLAEGEVYHPDALPPFPVRAGFYLFCAATAFVVLGLTAYTYNLDDIKTPGLFIGGVTCLAAWAVLFATDYVKAPPRAVTIPYLAYCAVLVASTIASAPFAKWIGWYYVEYQLALTGFLLLGSGTIRTKKMAELSLKFWVLLTFVTTALGLIHYSGILEGFYKMVWGDMPLAAERRTQALLKTFINARSMLSTILNVQFFGNFLLMLLPVVAACVLIIFRNMKRRLSAGVSAAVPISWATISGLSLVFALTCIFTTYSKSALVFMPALVLAFAAGIYLFCGVRRIPYLGLIITLGLVMGATVAAFTWADLFRQFKNVEESMGPRRIIWKGAWEIFLNHPVLGGGPGTFRIYFPEFRSPDYHITRISNVTLYAHNWVLDVLCETGVLGTITFFGVLGGLTWLAWRGLRTCPDMVLRVAVLGCLLGVGALLAGSLLNPMSRWPVGSVSLFAMMGTALGVIALALRNPAELAAEQHAWERDTPSAKRVPQWRWSLVVGSVALLGWVTPESVRGFQAAILHNEGLGYSEGLPASMQATSGGKLSNPNAVKYYREAERLFESAIELDPTRITTYYKLAHVHNSLGELDNALADYEKLREYAPDYAEVHFNLAVIYYNLSTDLAKQDPAKAREYSTLARSSFDRAGKLSNKISVWFYRANSYLTGADLEPQGSEERRKLLNTAGELFLQTAALPISTVIQEVGQTDREEEHRMQSLSFAGEAFSRAGSFAEAAKSAELYLARNPGSFTSIRRAVDFHKQAGQFDEALRVLRARLDANPLDADLNLLHVMILSEAGRPADAAAEARYLLLLNQRLAPRGITLLTDEKRSTLRTTLKTLEKSTQKPS